MLLWPLVNSSLSRRTCPSSLFPATATTVLGWAPSLPLPLEILPRSDLFDFRDLTSAVTAPGARNAVIMGRKTYESIPAKFRPLPNRLNVVVTRSVDELKKTLPNTVLAASSLEEALTQAAACERVFVIGGAQLYAESFKHPMCERIYCTEIEAEIECDTFLAPIDPSVFQVEERSSPIEERGMTYRYVTYKRS